MHQSWPARLEVVPVTKKRRKKKKPQKFIVWGKPTTPFKLSSRTPGIGGKSIYLLMFSETPESVEWIQKKLLTTLNWQWFKFALQIWHTFLKGCFIFLKFEFSRSLSYCFWSCVFLPKEWVPLRVSRTAACSEHIYTPVASQASNLKIHFYQWLVEKRSHLPSN